MIIMRIISLAFFSFTILLLTMAGCSIAFGQEVNTKVLTWEDKLFEKDVDYGAFACSEDQQKVVTDHFTAHPLRRAFGVCHNNCAVLKSISNTRWPIFSSEIGGKGFVSVHMLVNEKGQPIYARALNGHEIIRQIVQIRACKAVFEAYPPKRQTVIKVCISEPCGTPQPVL